jgi:hypothetical protein
MVLLSELILQNQSNKVNLGVDLIVEFNSFELQKQSATFATLRL